VFFDIGSAADGVRIEISPAGWTFAIWGLIYIWQAAWIIYVLVLTCKYEMESVIFGKWFYVWYSLGNIISFIWAWVWTEGYLWWAAVFILGIAIPLLVAAYIALAYMHRVARTVVSDNYGMSKWLANSSTIKGLLYGLVLNGVCFYATWCVVASHVGWGIALVHAAGYDDSTVCFLMLSILTAIILVYWFLDFYYLRSYLKYTYSPYAVLIWAFTGIFTNGGLDVEKRATSPFVLALLIIAVLGTIAKVIMGIVLRNEPVKESMVADEV